MAKKTKEHKPISRAAMTLRLKVAENVAALMERRFPAGRYPNQSDREQALAREAGCSWSTIQRMLDPVKDKKPRRKSDPGEDVPTFAKLDTLADLAVVFGCAAADLLTPNFAHDQQLPRGVPSSPSDEHELQRPSGRRASGL